MLPELPTQRTQPDEQASHLEQQRRQAEQEAANILDKDAMEAMNETQNAVNAIGADKPGEALAAIERAASKIMILLERNPASSLVPVKVESAIFDSAPEDPMAIMDIAADASRAFDDKDYPDARAFLHSLMSEIRVRSYNLPLSTYPTALKEAARLLQESKNRDAARVLQAALNTLVATDQITPIPLLRAREAVEAAQFESRSNEEQAQRLLEIAKSELDRARDLGYAGHSPEYPVLNDEISKLSRQLKGEGDTNPIFARLKHRIAALIKHETDYRRPTAA